MTIDFDNRKPYTPEATDVHGPGVDYWRGLREDNHFDQMKDDILIQRTDVRRRFSTNIGPVLAAICCAKN